MCICLNPAKTPRKPPRILIVDDDPGQRSLLNSFLRSQGFETVVVDSGERALETLRTGKFDMMISDVRMPGLTGLETLRLARKEHATLPVLLVTAFTDIRDAVAAMRDGAVNYLAKPIDLDELLASVQQAIGISESVPLRYSEDKPLPDFVVARSPLMQAVFRDASLIAPSETRVLITGESGVGKEVLADVIHAWSARGGPDGQGELRRDSRNAAGKRTVRPRKRLVHRRDAQRIGRFEEADGGTIFLDEIAEMSPPLQAKLLRVTQDGRFQRVGSNRRRGSSGRSFTIFPLSSNWSNRGLEISSTAPSGPLLVRKNPPISAKENPHHQDAPPVEIRAPPVAGTDFPSVNVIQGQP